MLTNHPKVLRYSALGAGVFYGFYHQRSLNAQFKMNDLTRKYQAEESLIAKAKAEYTKKTMPKESKTAGGDGEDSFSYSLLCGKEMRRLSRHYCDFSPIQSTRANRSFTLVISDPNDPRFDLEAYLTMKMADEAK
jgi:F-type H+-transporting ATP synthase subunit e